MKKGAFILLYFFLFVIWNGCTVNASETSDTTEKQLLEQFDFKELDQSFSEIFPEEKMNFSDTVSALLKGNMEPTYELFSRLLCR